MPKGKEIEKQVKVTIKEGSSRLVLANNQQQVIHTYLLYCAVCGRVVYSIDSTPDSLVESVATLEKQMLNSATYCPQCGQKLKYGVYPIVDAEYTETNKTYLDKTEQQEPETKKEDSVQGEGKEQS
jgi:uncharacterized protein with PIN domain